MAEPMDKDALARAAAATMWSVDRASSGFGMRIEEVAAGRAVLSMAVREDMVNGHGICHGGMIFTLADSTMAFASNSHNQNALAQQASITFLRPARLGDRLEATAVERSRSGRSGLYDVTVRRQDGTVVAEFRGHTRTIEGTIIPV